MKRQTRLQRLAHEEDGFSLVFVGLGFMAFLAVSMLAIDVGMLMTARSQAQNSADAGALAGATALVYNDYDDRTPTGPAVRNARAAALGNKVMGKNVDVQNSDVTFPLSPAGVNNRVKVDVFRTVARGGGADGSDPDGGAIPTLIAKYFNIASADISATATAEASPADAMTCVKPFTIPDRWLEMPGSRGSTNEDAFTMGTDVYRDPYSTNPTGYDAERDKGMLLQLKANNDSKIAPSFYYPWDMVGDDRGADDYRWSIGNCNVDIMGFGDYFVAKPGNMVGPTKQGMQDLIDRDPDARWDTGTNTVVSSMKPSPRVVAIPLFDPVYYFEGKMNGRTASLRFINYMGFFIERMNGDEVVGRITPIGGLRKGLTTGAPPAAFPKVIRLVQ